MRGSIRVGLAAAATCFAAAIAPAAALAAKPKPAHKKVFVVCKHGCRYTTIQSAVNASRRHATIEVKPGAYSEGVVVSGHRHDGLTIEGMGKKPSAVYLNGTHARVQGNAAQNAIEGTEVNNLTLENMKEEHYAANGFFINSCHGYTMKKLVAGFDHAYGMYVFKCVGGRMTQSIGFGNGDSAFYIGGTPFQKKHPVWTTVSHDRAYENVLGYSGTNSKYVKISHSLFYNNGAGVVPNTLASEPWEPATNGIIEHNKVFWNDFNYYLPGSPVKTVSEGLANGTLNYPTGAGVILFGTTGWVVKDNQIFGNWLFGGAAFSDPTNTTGKAENNHNRFVDNTMGYGGKDPNGVDFYNDGSGKGTCFENNGTHPTLQTSPTDPTTVLYPTCPTTAGSGTVTGDTTQVNLLLSIAGKQPPQDMDQFWHRHAHVKLKGFKPYGG